MNKLVYIFLFSIISTLHFGQTLTLEQWNEETKTNSRLLPKYGDKIKTDEELKADNHFIETTINQPVYKGDRTAASIHMVKLGFNYLYQGDLKTAMYRFNQSFLLDKNNSDIYWGYGTVYLVLGNLEEAKKQYEEGLIINPVNTNILTDLGTNYISQYYNMFKEDPINAQNNIYNALEYLKKSFLLDPKNQNTLFKLSLSYLILNDCKNATDFYEKCKQLGGTPITEEFTNELKKRCK